MGAWSSLQLICEHIKVYMTMHILRGNGDICRITKETHDSKCSEASPSHGAETKAHTANRNEQIGGGCSPQGSKDSRGPCNWAGK